MAADNIPYFYTASIKGDFPWPNRAVRLQYGEYWFQLLPPAADRYANVILEVSGLASKGVGLAQQDEYATIVHRFLSALSWSKDASLEVHAAFGGSRRIPVIGTRYAPITAPVPTRMWLPKPTDRSALRALGLVKEARAIRAAFPTIAFLWFYKTIEVCVGYKGKGPEKFYKAAVEIIRGRAKEAYDSIQLKKPLERYMRETRRHAIAHGEYADSIDPDDVAFVRKISAELPLIEQLAEIAIEQRFGIPRPATIDAEDIGEGWTRVFVLEDQPSPTPASSG